MYTHNLRDLQNINGILHVGTFKRGECLSKEFSEEEMVGKTIAGLYSRTIAYNENKLRATFMGIYGIRVDIPKGKVSDIVYNLKRIMSRTGKNITELTMAIRSYLGYKCAFVRLVGTAQVPVTIERIEKAYDKIQAKASFVEVENELYFDMT